MRAFHWIARPDARIVRRLMGLLRQGDSKSAFVTSGEALAATILGTRPDDAVPDVADELADAMVGSMIAVETGTSYDDDPDHRIRLALAAAVLSVVRPHTATACDHAISMWVGLGLGCPRRMDNPYALAARVLLSLLLDDLDQAADSVDTLVEIDRTGVAGVLHDWTVIRLQRHGPDREAQCFHHLRLSLSQAPGGGHGAALLVLAALVVARSGQQPRRAVVPWLDAIVRDVEAHGTTRAGVSQYRSTDVPGVVDQVG